MFLLILLSHFCNPENNHAEGKWKKDSAGGCRYSEQRLPFTLYFTRSLDTSLSCEEGSKRLRGGLSSILLRLVLVVLVFRPNSSSDLKFLLLHFISSWTGMVLEPCLLSLRALARYQETSFTMLQISQNKWRPAHFIAYVPFPKYVHGSMLLPLLTVALCVSFISLLIERRKTQPSANATADCYDKQEVP